MKFLKSQGIVLVLAAVAVLLVGRNLLWPFLKPKFASRPKPAPAANTSSPAAPSNATAKTTNPPTTPQSVASKIVDVLKAAQSQPLAVREKMNVQDLRAQAPNWISAPLRDPFKMRGGVSDKSAKDQLTLTGILRQTDSDLAVLNGSILAIGDLILGFRVETVEAERVWVSGPNGREALEFKYFVQAPKLEEKPVSEPAAAPLVTSSEAPVTSSAAPEEER